MCHCNGDLNTTFSFIFKVICKCHDDYSCCSAAAPQPVYV